MLRRPLMLFASLLLSFGVAGVLCDSAVYSACQGCVANITQDNCYLIASRDDAQANNVYCAISGCEGIGEEPADYEARCGLMKRSYANLNCYVNIPHAVLGLVVDFSGITGKETIAVAGSGLFNATFLSTLPVETLKKMNAPYDDPAAMEYLGLKMLPNGTISNSFTEASCLAWMQLLANVTDPSVIKATPTDALFISTSATSKAPMGENLCVFANPTAKFTDPDQLTENYASIFDGNITGVKRGCNAGAFGSTTPSPNTSTSTAFGLTTVIHFVMISYVVVASIVLLQG